MENIPESIGEKAGYRERYEQIISAPLSPENIDSYTDNALDALSGLVDDIMQEHQWDMLGMPEQEREDKIFREALGDMDVGDALEKIDEVGRELGSLDLYIDRVRQIPEQQVFVPPDQSLRPINTGSGEWREKETIPRTKTILFILQQDFGIDVKDKSQVKMSSGILNPDMIRGQSYDMIEVPELGRAILSCDESGNQTFIFDLDVLAKHNISVEMLKTGTKSQIKELLGVCPQAGRGLVYTKNFTDRIKGAIENPQGLLPKEDAAPEKSHYLERAKDKPEKPAAPDGYLTISRFAKEHQLNQITAQRLLEAHSQEVGPLEVFYIRGRALKYLSPEQQNILLSIPGVNDYLEKRGEVQESLTAPDGYLTLDGFAKKNQIHRDTAKRLLEEHREELGDLETFAVRGRMFEFLSPSQQEILLSSRLADGYLSVNKFSELSGIGPSTIMKYIRSHSAQLGEVQERELPSKFGKEAVTAHYLSPEQQQAIQKDIHLLPEGYMSAIAFRKKHQINQKAYQEFIKEHEANLGKIGRFGLSGSTTGISPEQQQYILENYKWPQYDTVPEGYVSFYTFAKDEHIGDKRLGRIIAKHSDELGKFTMLKRPNNQSAATYFSPEQQAILRKFLATEGEEKR